MLFILRIIYDRPWWWGQQIPLKRRKFLLDCTAGILIILRDSVLTKSLCLFRDVLFLWWWVVTLRPATRMEDHPVSAVSECLTNPLLCPKFEEVHCRGDPGTHLMLSMFRSFCRNNVALSGDVLIHCQNLTSWTVMRRRYSRTSECAV